MKKRMLLFQAGVFFSLKVSVMAAETKPVTVYLGYVTQVHCRGRLFLSSVGDPSLIQWEAFPKELGCGVVLKPKGMIGNTDLLIKTSTGDLHFILEVRKSPVSVRPDQLEIQPETITLKEVAE